jgi:hypothetical protein
MRAGTGETELAFPGFWENDRPPSRFSSEIGTNTDAKHQPWGFCVFTEQCFAPRTTRPEVVCAADEWIVTGFDG